MKIITAEHMGMCFGVRDALQITADVQAPAQVTIHGELVHNPQVLRQLHARGFAMQTETHRHAQIPGTPRVLITAHGISRRQQDALVAAGKELVDTTCPLVRKAHAAAQKLAAEARHVVVIGRAGHVEVEGLTGDLSSFTIVSRKEDVETWPFERLGVVCQTTTPEADARAILHAIRTRNPHADIRYIDTICQPTKDRQSAMETLLDEADIVVVVGGRNSNNTRQLVRRCADRGIPAFHIEHADELRPDWFTGCATVGLTAGTSTLPETIDAVRQALEQIAALHAAPLSR